MDDKGPITANADMVASQKQGREVEALIDVFPRAGDKGGAVLNIRIISVRLIEEQKVRAVA